METNLRDLTAKTSIACGKPNPRAARSLGSSVKIVVASSALPFWKPSSIVELSRPLPFRAAPSLHFAMSVSAEEVAKHNKDGDVSQGTRCQFCDVLGWGMQTCSSEDSDCWVIVGDQARNCLEGRQGRDVTFS